MLFYGAVLGREIDVRVDHLHPLGRRDGVPLGTGVRALELPRFFRGLLGFRPFPLALLAMTNRSLAWMSSRGAGVANTVGEAVARVGQVSRGELGLSEKIVTVRVGRVGLHCLLVRGHGPRDLCAT